MIPSPPAPTGDHSLEAFEAHTQRVTAWVADYLRHPDRHPVLAQVTLMGRVLKGEPMGVADTLLPALVCVLLAASILAWIARSLRQLAVR